ncbi:MAG: winged helix-turn-helix transcriptional regulator [Chelatococcus sp.]|jgi:DNA-binding MarR family transcriptional regulator|uniref:MarR family winged helix-turn-helix transcriptional regulator n=1 Tax=Chelatococcus sp. TaxID=1953771 RepID=UPI0025BB88F6|nr:MarR family winged helix-turn-helix transcriptional regulator [Chelatococcus sp.]MBX3539436.1 winged helix-turn-helix transcriptional regulator [Chelatococcus sp.]
MSTACHCIHLKTATRKLTALYDAALEPMGINISQFSLLRNIERRQPVSLTELGRELHLDRSTMGRNIRVIEKMGLVETGRGDDQREQQVSLSEHGAVLLRKAEPIWDDCQAEVVRRLGEQRLKALREINALL